MKVVIQRNTCEVMPCYACDKLIDKLDTYAIANSEIWCAQCTLIAMLDIHTANQIGFELGQISIDKA